MFQNLSGQCLRPLSLALVLLLVAACAPPLQTSEIRESHQPITGPLGAPWASIGRLTFRDRSAHRIDSYIYSHRNVHCTGTLVGPREVLTAAHCLWDARGGKWSSLISLVFRAGPVEGEFADYARIESYRILPARIQGGNFVDPRIDWAVLTLDRDLGDIYGFLPVLAFTPDMLAGINKQGAEFVHAVYGFEEPRLLAVNDSCDVSGFSSDEGVVLYHCATEDGDSGSPILLRDGEHYAIVAIHSGLLEWGDRDFGVGTPGQNFTAPGVRSARGRRGIDPHIDLDPAFRRKLVPGCPFCNQ